MKNKTPRIALAMILSIMFAVSQFGSVSADVQPSYDTLRVDDDGVTRLYQASVLWSPLVVPLPDGSAWAFFTAQRRLPTEPGADPQLSTFQLFSSRFDPASSTWSPAQALPGGVTFGPSAVIDSQGGAHLVYTSRTDVDPASFGTVVYSRTNADGQWTDPIPVSENPEAGHQLYPDIAVDANDGVHVAWQDQRNVSEEARLVDASNADVFVSDLSADGSWSDAVQVNTRPDDTTNASRPQLLAVNDRLIAIWSVYSTAAEIGLNSAIEIDWSARPLGDSSAWSEAQMILERGEDLIGGRFLDATSTAEGDVALVYGRRTQVENQLHLQLLPSGSNEWSESSLIAAGNRGSYVRAAAAPDGTIYSVFNDAGNGVTVEVGAVAVGSGQADPGPVAQISVGEEGQQGIASVAVDATGGVWVIYYHEVSGQPAPSETRTLRGADVPAEPLTPVQAAAPSAASPEADATPES